VRHLNVYAKSEDYKARVAEALFDFVIQEVGEELAPKINGAISDLP